MRERELANNSIISFSIHTRTNKNNRQYICVAEYGYIVLYELEELIRVYKERVVPPFHSAQLIL